MKVNDKSELKNFFYKKFGKLLFENVEMVFFYSFIIYIV